MPLMLSKIVQVGLPIGVFSDMAKKVTEFEWETELGNSLIVRRADRGGWSHHPVELPPLPDLPEGGSGLGRRLHGGAEAQRDRAPERLRAR